MGNAVDGVGLGALGDADGQDVLVDVQDVAALNVERVVAAVVLRGALEVRVIREDVLAVDRLAVARDGIHAVDGHAVADHRERVAREVQVRHGGHHHLGGLGHQVDQGVGLVGVQLGQVDALHGLQHEVLGVGVVLLHVIKDDLAIALGLDAGLIDPLQQELLAKLRVGGQNLGRQVLQVHNLHAVVAQSLRESVVLFLGNLQKRNVVEQQLFKRVRGKVQQLLTGSMQQDFLQGLDFALDVYASHNNLLSSRWDIKLSSPCEPRRILGLAGWLAGGAFQVAPFP